MPGNTDNNDDRGKRRDAINAVRLMCLDHESAAAASKTFKLYPADLVAARRVLNEWPEFRLLSATEQERVDYLLNAGWKKRRRP